MCRFSLLHKYLPTKVWLLKTSASEFNSHLDICGRVTQLTFANLQPDFTCPVVKNANSHWLQGSSHAIQGSYTEVFLPRSGFVAMILQLSATVNEGKGEKPMALA